MSINLADKKDLYMQAKDFVVEHVRKGNYRPDQQLPSNREFAKMINVSPLTIQKAVCALVQEGLLYARRGKGTFVRDPLVSLENHRRTGLYACIVPTIRSNTVAATVSTLDDLIFKNSGHHMLLCNSLGDLEREVTLLDSLLDRAVDAIVYQSNPLAYRRPVFVRAIEARLQKFLAAGVPVVMIDDLVSKGKYDAIVPNEREMCELALKHLLELGHNRIVFLAHSKMFQDKIEAFGDVVKSIGLKPQQVRMVLAEGDDINVIAAEGLQKVLDDGWPFTGIIAATDYYALYCYRFLKSQNIKCPDDVSIVGADNLEFIENVEFGFTTVWSEPEEIARQVQQQIELRLGKGDLRKVSAERVEVSAKIVVRQSTAAPNVKFGEQ